MGEEEDGRESDMDVTAEYLRELRRANTRASENNECIAASDLKFLFLSFFPSSSFFLLSSLSLLPLVLLLLLLLLLHMRVHVTPKKKTSGLFCFRAPSFAEPPHRSVKG